MKAVRPLLFVLSFLAASSAHAQRETFQVDPAASTVEFSLTASMHNVKGVFHAQSGAIDFDPASAKISGSVVVAAGSGDSNDKGRDKKMLNDVLEAPKYSDITFTPRSYEGTLAATGDSTIQVTGVFTLRGTPHDLTVPMQVHLEGSHSSAKTHFTIPFVQWGLKDPSNFMLKVGKTVDIDLTLAGSVAPAK